MVFLFLAPIMNQILPTAMLLTCLFLAGSALAADGPLVVNVWPGKPAGDVGIARDAESSRPSTSGMGACTLITDVSKPTLTIYRPAKDRDNGAAVLICPGGGYHDLAWDKEGTEVAEWLNSLGVTGIVLKYRVPRRPGESTSVPPPGPLKDAQRAVSLVRSNAKEWGIDPQRIGIVGFSAGGHLAAATATNFNNRSYEPIDEADQVSCRPDFAILVYPAYLKLKDKDELAPGLPISAETPPLFLVHCNDDTVAKADNSVLMYLAAMRAHVRAELHIYAAGGHGFGLRSGKPCSTWTVACADWMKNGKLLSP
jgi:acetyl esterase/lipase